MDATSTNYLYKLQLVMFLFSFGKSSRFPPHYFYHSFHTWDILLNLGDTKYGSACVLYADYLDAARTAFLSSS